MNKNLIYNIGIFDSGIGGLNVLKELKKVIPNCNYLYFADTKNLPYGTKSNKEILSYSYNIIEFFISKKIRHVAIACNTASAIAYNILQEKYKNEITLFPVLQYGLLGAKNYISNLDKIAVLATKATISSRKYESILKTFNPRLEILNIDGTGLVEVIEGNLYNTSSAKELFRSIIDIIQKHKIDNVIWGCTHYGCLEKYFTNYFNCNYIDPARYLALEVKKMIGKNIVSNKNSTIEYYATGKKIDFMQSAKQLLNVENVKNVF